MYRRNETGEMEGGREGEREREMMEEEGREDPS